jgi:diamine N-acetyltransferase
MIDFKLADRSDIFTIQQLARSIWFSHYPGILSDEQIEYMLSMMYSAETITQEIKMGYAWYLMMISNQPVGFIAFHKDSTNSVKLEKLYLMPNFHGKGYGQAALNFIKARAIDMKADFLYLRVNKFNKKAINAYTNAGFVIDSEDKGNIGNGYFMDDYIMKFEDLKI